MNQDRARGEDGYHRPVLAEEVAALVAPTLPGVVVDATFGGGGHSARMLDEFGEEVTLIAIDRDPDAVANAANLGVTAIQGNFAELHSLVRAQTDAGVVGILFDFGVSSHQLETPDRGFSYRHDGPLDMRMGPDAGITADEIVNRWPVQRLTEAIRRFGEVPQAHHIAQAIVRGRPYSSTSQVATVIAEATPAARRRAGHPARRIFQAIRIAVNDELTAIEAGIDQAIDLLEPGGRLVAISYHSLEDRIVKQRLAEGARGCVCPPDLPVCGCGQSAELILLTRKPVRPTEQEIAVNSRARSAVLRAAEKVAA